MIYDLSDVAMKNLQIEAYTDKNLTEDNKVNISCYFTTEPLILTPIPEGFCNDTEYQNKKLTKYKGSDCKYITKIYLFPFSVNGLNPNNEYFIKVKEAYHAVSATQRYTFWSVGLGFDFENNENIPWPSDSELNPDGLIFTDGYKNISKLDASFFTGLCPGALNSSLSTVETIGYTDLISCPTTVQNPFILFKKFILTKNYQTHTSGANFISVYKDGVESNPYRYSCALGIIGVTRIQNE